MEITVDGAAEIVLLALEGADYADSTIRQYKKTVKALKALAEGQGGAYTQELGERFAAMTHSPVTGRPSKQREYTYGRLVRLIDSYVGTGEVDLSLHRPPGDARFPRSEGLACLLGTWEADMERRGLARSTRDYYGRLAREFLLHLEALGIGSVGEAGPPTVSGFLAAMGSGRYAGTSMRHLVSNFRPFLRFTGRQDLVDAADAARVPVRRGIAPSVGDGDIAKALSACVGGAVPAQDAAITLLALLYGIRASDIVGMRVGDIDWLGGSISIVQQKTGNPLTLPLLPAVGNALSCYLLKARPPSDDDHVFLRSMAPHTALSGHSAVYAAISRTFSLAGADVTAVGTMLLRHSAATRMVAGGVPVAVAAAVLGHADPDSTDGYIAADVERMRACVLPLPGKAGS